MSVNNNFANNSQKLKKLGRYFASIDFDINETYSGHNYLKNHQANVGTFSISSDQLPINLEQLNYLKNICENYICKTKQNAYNITIAGREYIINYNELDRIYETILNVLEIIDKKYRLNLLF